MSTVRAVLTVARYFLRPRKAGFNPPRGVRRRLVYEWGYLRFLWRAETGQIGFREDELEELAEKLRIHEVAESRA